MQYKKRYNRKKKRGYKKKKSYRSSFTKYKGAGLTRSYPLGQKFLFKTRYCEVGGSIDVGALGGGSAYIYRLTSLFDPNHTGIGHQPIGFDEMMSFYDTYTVIGARVKVNFSNTDGSNPATVALHISDSSTVVADLSNTFENGNTRWTTLSPSDGGQACKCLTMNFSPKKFFGKNTFNDDKYQGKATTNPVENAFVHVIVAGADLVTDIQPVLYDITIEYVAVLTEPKNIASS